MSDDWSNSAFYQMVNPNFQRENTSSINDRRDAENHRRSAALAEESRKLPQVMKNAGCTDEAITAVVDWWTHEALPKIGGHLLESQLIRALAIQFEQEHGPDWASNPEASAKHQEVLNSQMETIRNINAGRGGTLLF